MSILSGSLRNARIVRATRAAGRVRIQVPLLWCNPALAARIEAAVRGRTDVLDVRASVRTGRVLITVAPGSRLAAELEDARATSAPHRAARRRDGARPSAPWHALTVDRVSAELGVNERRGLDAAEARSRLERFGPNRHDEEPPPSALVRLAAQLANLPAGLLAASAGVSLLLGDIVEAAAIAAVLAIDAGVGYRVERTSDELLASWRRLEDGTAAVIRDRAPTMVAVDGLVPGDVLVVRAGDVVHADARVCDAHRLGADESALTGESEPVDKSADPCADETPLAGRRSMLYRGTRVATGHGRAIVVATGDDTEIASVQRMAAGARAPAGRLQARLDRLTTRLAALGVGAGAVSLIAGVAWRRPGVELLREAVALAVAAIPEGLPVTATAALVRAMARMRDRGMVVRRLATAETLGAVTVACVDKTGTLTENRMQVETLVVDDGVALRRIDRAALASAGRAPLGPVPAILAAGVLNSDIDYQHDGHTLELIGSATETALVATAQVVGVDPVAVRARWPRTRLIERSRDVHYVVSEHAGGLAIVKGAPEQVVALCELSAEVARRALVENATLAGDGLRVLALACRTARDPAWRLLGLIALRDPVRAGAAEAVREAARAGIRTVMLTGDQRATAHAIARRVGIAGDVIEGTELADLLAAPDADRRLRQLSVVARVTPAEKVAVVEALRRAGEVVAMAGDGINDAPALRAADVGIAVGAGASDLARQTADVVLAHEDLRSILAAVAEGRAVQDNLRRAIRFQIAGNTGEIIAVVGAALLGRPLLSSLALLWINLLTDTMPALALALDPTGDGTLDRPPAPHDAPILSAADWREAALTGAAIGASGGLAAALGGPLAAFAVLGFAQFGYAVACRAPTASPRTSRFGALVGGSAALHALATSAPARAALRIGGSPPIAAIATAAALGVPLYVSWRRAATREITRAGAPSPPPETTS